MDHRRLAALIRRPGVNLTRYHSVFAPNSRWRARVMPSGRGKHLAGDATATEPEKHRAMTWARRLKPVFKIDVSVCEHCGGMVKIPRSCASMRPRDLCIHAHYCVHPAARGH